MNRERKSRVKFIVALLTLSVLVIYGVWSQLPKNTESSANPSEKVTVAQFGDFFLYAPLYVAVDAGLFEKRRLNVAIVNTGGDDKTWAAVLSGSAQFGIADPTFIAVSGERGQHGVVVASIVNGVPFWGITFKKIEQINDPAELQNYRVATFPSPSTAYTLQYKMFQDAGLSPNIREAGFGAIIPALKAGDADIGLELEPNVSQAISNGAHIVYSMAKKYGDFAITGLTATNQMVKSKPKIVNKMVSALQESLDLIRANPELALSFLERRFPGVKKNVAKEALIRVIDDNVVPKTTTITQDAWDKAISVRMQIGDLKKPAPYEEYVLIK